MNIETFIESRYQINVLLHCEYILHIARIKDHIWMNIVHINIFLIEIHIFLIDIHISHINFNVKLITDVRFLHFTPSPDILHYIQIHFSFLFSFGDIKWDTMTVSFVTQPSPIVAMVRIFTLNPQNNIQWFRNRKKAITTGKIYVVSV